MLPSIYLDRQPLKFVIQFKYLGVILTHNLNNELDIENNNGVFLRQFWGLYRRFYFADKQVMSFLFQYHCSSFYGSFTWFDRKNCKGSFHSLAVAYHKCVKKILGVPWSMSNRKACHALNLSPFRHLINRKFVNFSFSLMRNNSHCILPVKHFLLNKSVFSVKIKSIFSNAYGITDLFDNDFDAIMSRIAFVESAELKAIV